MKKYVHLFLLIFIMLIFINNAFASQLGDVNDDSAVDIVDALMVAQYFVGLIPPGFNVLNADVNFDGYIDIVDALLIAQCYVGLIPCPTHTPPPCKPDNFWDCSNFSDWEFQQSTQEVTPDDIFILEIKGSGASMISPGKLSLNAFAYDTIRIRMKSNISAHYCLLDFKTYSDEEWQPEKSYKFSINNNGNFNEYLINLRFLSHWTGEIEQLRLRLPDSVNSGTLKFDYFFLTYDILPEDIIIRCESTTNLTPDDLIENLKELKIFNYHDQEVLSVIKEHRIIINPGNNEPIEKSIDDSIVSDLAGLYEVIDFNTFFDQFIRSDERPMTTHINNKYISYIPYDLAAKVDDLVSNNNGRIPKEEDRVYWQKLVYTLCGILTQQANTEDPNVVIRKTIITPNSLLHGTGSCLIEGAAHGNTNPDPDDPGINEEFFKFHSPVQELESRLRDVSKADFIPERDVRVIILDSIPEIRPEDFLYVASNPILSALQGDKGILTIHEYTADRSKFEILGDCLPCWDPKKKVCQNKRTQTDHGLFSAGIIYELTRHAKIDLIEVLNDGLVGNIFTIADGIRKTASIAGMNRNVSIVVNFSLVLRGYSYVYMTTDDCVYKFLKEEFENLNTIPACSTRGFICAASGNDFDADKTIIVSVDDGSNVINISTDEWAYPKAPALYEGIYGIGAFTIHAGDIERAPYSRIPDIAPDDGYGAMGGGLIIEIPDQPKSTSLLSVSTSQFYPELSPDGNELINTTGWIRGTGTSFATAVASGVLALLLLTEEQSTLPFMLHETIKTELEIYTQLAGSSYIMPTYGRIPVLQGMALSELKPSS